MKYFFTAVSIFCLCIATLHAQNRTNNIQSQSNVNQSVITELEDYRPVLGKDTSYIFDASQIRIGKKFQIDNLEVFQILGPSSNNTSFTTLKDAMISKDVTVHETSNVSQLAVENHSDDYVFLSAGDIVKGGKQDRTLQYDMILPPLSGRTDLSSFCVESGRWRNRGDEEVKGFSVSEEMISSRDMKVASKYEKNQSKVWSEVSEQQENLNANSMKYYAVAVDVRDDESATSLQLTLENEELVKLKEAHAQQFEGFVEDGVVGFAYVINGELYGIEVYNNEALFRNVWDKQMRSFITESFSEKIDSLDYNDFAIDAVRKQLLSLEMAQRVEVVNSVTQVITGENRKGNMVVFTTIDRRNSDWIHRSYLTIK